MPGLTARAGWLSTTHGPPSTDTETSPDTNEEHTHSSALGVAGGPRLARAILLAVLCAFAAVQVINELTAPFPSRGYSLAVGFTSLAVLFSLTVLITTPQA